MSVWRTVVAPAAMGFESTASPAQLVVREHARAAGIKVPVTV